jgi:hypothetical protein
MCGTTFLAERKGGIALPTTENTSTFSVLLFCHSHMSFTRHYMLCVQVEGICDSFHPIPTEHLQKELKSRGNFLGKNFFCMPNFGMNRNMFAFENKLKSFEFI